MDSFDPSGDCHRESFASEMYQLICRESQVENLKASIMIAQSDEGKIWGTFQAMKSEFINHWMPHFKYKSGDILEDTLEVMRKHVWAHRVNRSIKRTNMKVYVPSDRKIQKIWQEAPDPSLLNLILEMPTFIHYHDHPFISTTTRDRGEELLIGDDDNVTGNMSVTKRVVSRQEQKAKKKKTISRTSKKTLVSDEKI